ncbi:MAG TPA: FTR1 family protein, partial [Marmoricola sp.]|nr:FTR1 family protein [Marmoricola sp.]
LSGELKGQIDLVAEGSWFGLVLVAFLAVAREGLETALFLWAATQTASAGGSATGPIIGAGLGLAVAVAMGYAFYKGALQINLSKFFAWTGGFLIIVAAGVLAYGFHDLQEAGILPGLNNLAFDVSHIIEPTSFLGTLLKGIFNFSPQTTWVEAAAWLGYVAVVMPLFLLRIRGDKPTPSPTQTAPSVNANTNN